MGSLRQRAFLPVLFFVGAVVAIVSSMGAPLIPALAEQLNVSIGAAQWALTATLVVAAVTSPLVSRLGDGRLRKRMIVGGLAVVVAGGAMAALASSLAILIIGRGLQGLGYAMLPLTMATARDHLPAAEARKAIATLSVMGAAGVGLGYPLSGLIADHGGVSAAYWFGATVSFVALLFALWALPDAANPPAKQPLDLPGAALIGFGLVVLLIALDKAPDYGWANPWIVASICVGLLSLAVWAFYELRIEHPLVNLRLMKHRPVLTANITGLLISVIMYLALVTISQLVLNPTFGFGATIFVTGLTIVPLSVFSSGTSRFLPRLEESIGIRKIIPLGGSLLAVAMLFFAATSSQLWQAFVTMGILGVALGFTFAAMPGLIVRSAAPDETSSALGLYQVSRLIGSALGSGLAITFLRAFGDNGVPDLSSYRATALATAGIALLAAVLAWVLLGSVRASRAGEDEAFEARDGRLAAAGLEDLTESAR